MVILMINKCHSRDIPMFSVMSCVLAAVSVCMDPLNVALWCMTATCIVKFLCETSKSLPFVLTMLTPAVFALQGVYTGAQLMALAAYLFFFLGVEFEGGRPAPPVPLVVVKRQELSENPTTRTVEIEDI